MPLEPQQQLTRHQLNTNELKAVWEAVKQYGLPVGNVYATNRQDKSIVLSEIGASVHYDDSEFRLQQIHKVLTRQKQKFFCALFLFLL